MDRRGDDRRGIVPQDSSAPSRKQLLRRKPGIQRTPQVVEEPEETIVTRCNRCGKDFVQKKARDEKAPRGKVGRVPRLYKLCEHCREMGKGRSRRWQMRTKEHGGLCRRCGIELTSEDGTFVLCAKCRLAFRDRKERRAAEGLCVQCCEPMVSANSASESVENNDEDIDENDDEAADEEPRPKKIVRARCKRCSQNKQKQPKPFTSDFIQSMYK